MHLKAVYWSQQIQEHAETSLQGVINVVTSLCSYDSGLITILPKPKLGAFLETSLQNNCIFRVASAEVAMNFANLTYIHKFQDDSIHKAPRSR